MADHDAVEQALADFVAEFERIGEADPIQFLDRVEGAERDELAALIDSYLENASRRPWDPEAFRGSHSEAIADQVARSVVGRSGMWPSVLPQARMRARIGRRELARRLAEALGAPDKTEKVARYYHQMESGILPASGVSDRVLGALGELVGESLESLRRAGDAVSEAGPIRSGEVLARVAADADGTQLLAREDPEPQDEVDRLFRGG